MNIPSQRLFCCAAFAVFVLGGCCTPRRGVPFADALPPGSRGFQGTALVLAPILAARQFESGGRPASGLLLRTAGAPLTPETLAAIANPAIGYPVAPWHWQVVEVPPEIIARIATTLLADPTLVTDRATPTTGLSIRLVRFERGCPVAAELFVDQATARSFAARVTNATIGTPALRGVLQWEMNL